MKRGNTTIPKIIEKKIMQNHHVTRIKNSKFDNLKITNTLFRNKDIHKYAEAACGYQSIVDGTQGPPKESIYGPPTSL